jgi:hypothetical protein
MGNCKRKKTRINVNATTLGKMVDKPIIAPGNKNQSKLLNTKTDLMSDDKNKQDGRYAKSKY